MQVRVLRGGMLDSVHEVAACAADSSGAVLHETPGAAGLEVFMRSCAKPFQAVPAVAAGVLDALGLDDRHLAVACASHAGSDEHAALVAEILAGCGLDSAALACGDDGRHDPLRHNCSGNHALGLALCVASGWPTRGYLEPAHPLQESMRAAVADVARRAPREAGDGCGMRAYRLPLATVAAMFARLGSAPGALGRCAAAMRAHPHLVCGAGELDTELMRADPRLVAKVGAEGAHGLGADDGLGMAVKVLDGASRALAPAVCAAGSAWLGLPRVAALDPICGPVVLDNRGGAVGRMGGFLQEPNA